MPEKNERVARARTNLAYCERRKDWALLNGDRWQRAAAQQLYDSAKRRFEEALKTLKAVEGQSNA